MAKKVCFKKTIYFEIPLTEEYVREMRGLNRRQKTKPSDYRAVAVSLSTDILRKNFSNVYIFPRGQEYVYNEDGTQFKNEYHKKADDEELE